MFCSVVEFDVFANWIILFDFVDHCFPIAVGVHLCCCCFFYCLTSSRPEDDFFKQTVENERFAIIDLSDAVHFA